ncbi:MAG TPA: outer membrane protein transport protein [Polyangia bacterium]|nr:outer membrane protein transport protein [Polyangia bacterium]
MKRWLVCVFTAAAALGAGRICRANGFLIYDLSGEAIGRASAVSASTDEPAAVWFNPAALAFMGPSASVGGVYVTAKSRFSPADGSGATDSQRGNFFLPTVFATAPVTERVAVGLGVYTAFGIGIEWPNGWIGREAAIAASLQTLAINPTVAVRLDHRLSLAVGFDAVRGAVDFKNGLPAQAGGQVELGGGTWGYGFNAALLYRPLPNRLQAALTYRSRVKLSFDGQADFDPDNPDFGPALPDQPGTATITLPDALTLGVMFRPREDLVLEADLNYVLWSTYDQIDIAFQSAPEHVLKPEGHNAFTARLGADYGVALPGAQLHLRAGFIFDQQAIPAQGLGPGLPDGNRLDGTLGVGYTRGRFTGDLGYMLVYVLDANSTTGREGPIGTYSTIAQLVGVTVRARWP